MERIRECARELPRLECRPKVVRIIDRVMHATITTGQTIREPLLGAQTEADRWLPHYLNPQQDDSVSSCVRRNRRCNTIHVEVIARAAGLSRRVLERRFRAAFGVSVYEQLQRAHLEQAEELMVDPALSLAEIAHARGHESQRHLNIVFRRLTSSTPGEYRQQRFGR